MHFYRTIDCNADPDAGRVDWHATLADAHRDAKLRFPTSFARNNCRVELIDIAFGKVGILALLRGHASTDDVLRTWRLSDRGGLIETPNGE